MEFLATILAFPATIATIVLGLIIWAVWSLAKLYRQTKRLIEALRQGLSIVAEPGSPRAFAANFEAASQQLDSLELISTRWSAFRDTLILPEADLPSPLIRSTLHPDAIFDLGLLRPAGVRPRYQAAMPGMLVGAGLLFTFLGLAAALSVAGGVVAGGNPALSRFELHKLLDTASFKFITSLAGLGLSILYTLLRNGRMRAVEQALDGFDVAIERNMPLATPAFLQHEANGALRQQLATLDTFSNELAVNIGQALDRAIDQRLGEHIGPLHGAIEGLTERIGSQSQDFVKEMLQGIADRLSGGTRDHLDEVTGRLAALGTHLEGLQAGLGDASARMAEAADDMARRMGDGAEAALRGITGQMAEVVETLRNVAAQTRDAGADAAQALAARIHAAAAAFETAASGSSQTITNGASDAANQMQAAATDIRQALETTGQGLARQAAVLGSNAERLAGQIAQLDRIAREAGAPLAAGAADLRRSAEAAQAATAPLHTVAISLDAAVNRLDGSLQRFSEAQASAAKLAQAVAAAGQRFEGVDLALAGTLSGLNNGLDEFTRKIHEFVRGTNTDLAKAATHIGTLVKELSDALEDHGFNGRGPNGPQPAGRA